MNVKAQSFYDELRDVVKSSFSCAVGSVMSNRIPVIVPCSLPENPYEERIDLVEQARNLVSRLETGSMPDFVSDLAGSDLCGNWSALTVKHSAR